MVSISTPNFIEIGLSAVELRRHSDFQDGGRQPCRIWFRIMVANPRSASGLCFVLKFRLHWIYSFGDTAIFTARAYARAVLGVGSRNSVRPSLCPSVCHTRAL